MEPDVIRMYASSPPPMDDGGEEEENEFGDFGTFSGVPPSISFTDFDTPTTFNQTQALTATSPPELLSSRGMVGFGASNGHRTSNDLSRANGVGPEKRPGSGPSERTETKKALATSPEICASDVAVPEPPDCNGGGAEVLTNGFATFDVQGSPPLQNAVQSRFKGTPAEAPGPVCSPEDDFADFAAFSNAEGRNRQTPHQDAENPADEHHIERGTTSEDTVRDANRTGPDASESDSTPVPAEALDRGPRTDAGSPQRDEAFAQERFASQADCTNGPASLNGVAVAHGDDSKDDDLSPDCSGETSLGRALSTDALEEYGDASTTGSAPSPSLHGETASPTDLSQPAEDEEDFGHFGDAGPSGSQAFADFDCPVVRRSPAQETMASKDSDDFGDFNSPQFQSGGDKSQDGEEFADFPPSGSFGNFSSAVDAEDGEADAGWRAFGEQQVEEESWAAFSTEAAPPAENRKEEAEEEGEWHESGPPAVSEEISRTDRLPVALSSRLERLFQSSFPRAPVLSVEDEVTTLKILLGPPEDEPQPGAEEKTSPCRRSACGSVWTQLQDINEAVGLRYQWGGSHCNKTLLCCLGIDTRNILFTGQKKQPVIVPMYAASLGMLEPTKEPVKPVSAAEMIASIGQAPPVAPASSSGPSDSVQEALPPVQFDWSSSGLTNPLDASGGSSLLNLDFFGPVEDSGSASSASIPGVDPELFELTTAKMDSGGSGSRVADAFARLMSTMEKNSTSTRKPRKEENLSAEAARVIAGLPDLSFMQAKVLMFPATLTPIGSQATPD